MLWIGHGVIDIENDAEILKINDDCHGLEDIKSVNERLQRG